MSAVNQSQQHPSRVLARVAFVTWAPSEPGGEINTTRRSTIIVKVWVNHPMDERYKTGDRGGEHAVKVVKATAARRGMEWLGLMGVEVDMDDQESLIVNQPKDQLSDVGLEPMETLPDARPRIITS